MQRWRRFSLSTLLLVMTAICIWLGLYARRAQISAANASQMRQLKEIKEEVHQIVWSPDGRQVAFVPWAGPVDLRDVQSFSRERLIGKGRKLIDFAFHPDGRRVALCDLKIGASVLDLQTGAEVRLFTTNDQPSVAFSPDGSIVSTGGYGTQAHLWRTEDGKLLHTLPMGLHLGGLTCAFSPDGKTVAVGNRNFTTKLFDVASGQELCELPKQSTHEIEFSPDGSRLAVAYVDGSLAIWSVPNGKLLQQCKTTGEEVYRVEWAPDGKMLASAGLNGKISFWEAASLKLLHELPSPQWVIDLKFTPDGQQLFTAGGGQTIGSERSLQVWGVPPLHERMLGRGETKK